MIQTNKNIAIRRNKEPNAAPNHAYGALKGTCGCHMSVCIIKSTQMDWYGIKSTQDQPRGIHHPSFKLEAPVVQRHTHCQGEGALKATDRRQMLGGKSTAVGWNELFGFVV